MSSIFRDLKSSIEPRKHSGVLTYVIPLPMNLIHGVISIQCLFKAIIAQAAQQRLIFQLSVLTPKNFKTTSSQLFYTTF